MKQIPVRHISVTKKEPGLSDNFSIRELHELLAGKDMVQELHRHDFFYLLDVKKGTGKHSIDFTPYTVGNNAIFFMRPGQVHQLELKANCTGFLMQFNTAFYYPTDKLSALRLRKAGDKNYCTPDADRFEKLQAILTNILQEHTNKQEGYLDAIKANLDIFFIELIRQSANPKGPLVNTGSYAQERLEEFSSLLEAHIATRKQVSDYTHLMNLSAYQLNEITKATVGKTASVLINEYIVLEAKRYLLATSNQIKDIADHLGYEDDSYFIRFFRKQTGFSPEAFRHHHSV